MLELDDNLIELKELEEKLQRIGDSLWHFQSRRWINNTSKWDDKAKLLGRPNKI